MQKEIHGLILNDKLYPIDELLKLSKEKSIDPMVPEWEKDVYRFILELYNDKDSVTLTTSGSSGTSKSIIMPKTALFASAELSANVLNFKYGQTALLCLPVKYIAGKMMIVRALNSGLNLKIVEPSSMPDLSKFTHVDLCSMVPIQAYNSLNDYQFQTHIDTLLIGGGEIRDELEVKLRELPNKVHETYGMTETCSHVALRRINGTEPDDSFKVIEGIKLSLDERGCLKLKVPFLKEEIVTNDLVQIINDSQFKWVGRFDNIINSGGLKIQPEVLEKEIEKIIKLPSAIIDQPDPAFGQRLTLVVETELKENQEEKLLNKLKGKLDKHQIPKKVYTVPELPRNASLKIDRIALRLMLKEING